MKNLITILILLVAAGCSKTENATVTEPETQTGKTELKPLSPEEKLVGSYEAKVDEGTFKAVFFENGKVKVVVQSSVYRDDEKEGEGTWTISGKEVHVSGDEKPTTVFKIEPNGDLTFIATINKTGKREGVLKRDQSTYKKLKE